jgi:hypothetical protein
MGFVGALGVLELGPPRAWGVLELGSPGLGELGFGLGMVFARGVGMLLGVAGAGGVM